jgi:hypothetical protein
MSAMAPPVEASEIPDDPSGNRSRRLAIAKQEFEIEKLKVEIAQATDEINASRSVFRKIKSGLAILISITALGSGIFGVIKIAGDYFAQRERQLRFEVSKEVIELSKQLGSDDRIARSNAALLLSEYGEHAVPILVSALGETNKPGLPDRLIYSLELILKKERIKENPQLVLEPLLRQTGFAIQEMVKASKPDLESVSNYLAAIGHLAAGCKDARVSKALDAFKKEIHLYGFNMSDNDKELMIKKIDTAKKRTMQSDQG